MSPETKDIESVLRETRTCTRVNDHGEACGKPLDTTGYPLWCKACRNAHRKAYNATVKEMSETRGFAAGFATGADSMRAKIVGHCKALGNGRFAGIQIAGWISKLKNPSPQP